MYVHQKYDKQPWGYSLRLKPGQDLKQAIVAFVQAERLQAACIITRVGSLQKASLRLANQSGTTTWDDKFDNV